MKTPDQITPTFAPVYACSFYPDLARLCIVNGYALAIHGSLQRDLDLIAIPWVAQPTPREDILKLMCKEFGFYVLTDNEGNEGTLRAHGRMVYT